MLDVVLADGGMDVTVNYNAQEILNKQLLLCQLACAMAVLREGLRPLFSLSFSPFELTQRGSIDSWLGGQFLCKTCDLFTPFSADLVYRLYRHFRRVCIFKPHTSRPANSERFAGTLLSVMFFFFLPSD